MSLVNKLKKYVKRGDFTLSSGRKSSYYIDIKGAYSDPVILKEIAVGMAGLIGYEKPDAVAGVAVGGIPLATALSLETGLPLLIVRKEAKGHGTQSKIEGEMITASKVIIVEDVTTAGNSALAAVHAVREGNGICEIVLAVVDREEGAEEKLREHGVKLKALVRAAELLS
jgi:orotate phosphoribosyltransferase